MKQSAHHLLARLAGHDRKQREMELADLRRRRGQFRATRTAVAEEIVRLRGRIAEEMGGGMAVAELTAIQCAVEEKRAMVLFLDRELARLEEEEQELIRRWAEAGVREKVHEDADRRRIRRERRREELKRARQMEDLFAGSRAARGAVVEEG
ncbi:MAG: hypothetical protein D6682_05580 [Zetaproteobacteria bacterium]|nr:MAG: hypothetical protein D6682_05580 [Zetaproteobacteria bacterium]